MLISQMFVLPALGGITHNHLGQLTAAYSGAIASLDPLEAKSQSLLQGFKLCSAKGIQRSIVERNTLLLLEVLYMQRAYL